MNGSLLLAVAVATMGSDSFGWQPLPGGGLEYIIQIGPHIIDRLKDGVDITSDVPANVKNIRSCRFTVGSGELPKIDEPPVLVGHEDQRLPFSPPDDAPLRLPWKEDAEDGVKQTVLLEDPEPTPASPQVPEPATKPDDSEPAPPWLLATLSIGLMGTSAGMIFTGWTAWDYRGRYRRVLEKLTVTERMELDMAANDGG